MLLTGCIIWPISLSRVNWTNFQLEQQVVCYVLGPKRCQNEWTPQTHVALAIGGHVLLPFHCAMEVLWSISIWFSPVVDTWSHFIDFRGKISPYLLEYPKSPLWRNLTRLLHSDSDSLSPKAQQMLCSCEILSLSFHFLSVLFSHPPAFYELLSYQMLEFRRLETAVGWSLVLILSLSLCLKTSPFLLSL